MNSQSISRGGGLKLEGIEFKVIGERFEKDLIGNFFTQSDALLKCSAMGSGRGGYNYI